MSSDEELYQQWRAGQAEIEAARQALDMSAPTLMAAVGNVDRAQADMIAAWHKRETELLGEIATLRRLLDEAQRELAARDKPWLNEV